MFMEKLTQISSRAILLSLELIELVTDNTISLSDIYQILNKVFHISCLEILKIANYWTSLPLDAYLYGKKLFESTKVVISLESDDDERNEQTSLMWKFRHPDKLQFTIVFCGIHLKKVQQNWSNCIIHLL